MKKKEISINIGRFPNKEKVITEILKENRNNRFDSFCLKKNVLTLTFIEEFAPDKRIMVKQINKKRQSNYTSFLKEFSESSWKEIGHFELKLCWIFFFEKA